MDLTVDKKATVAAHHGWEGKKYMASGTGVDGTYEAVVYSNVGTPTPGQKFNAQYDLALNAMGQWMSIRPDRRGRGESCQFELRQDCRHGNVQVAGSEPVRYD